MNPHEPPIPAPGRPKKGFWGFVASLFPKRPQILEAPTPTSDSSATNKPSELNPSQSQPGQSSDNPGAPDKTPHKTNEQAAPNSQGETGPPTVSAPRKVKRPGLEDNEGKPPTLPDK